MPFYQTIYISKNKGKPAEQQVSVLFRDIFILPEYLPSAENCFLLAVIKPDGLPVWFAAKNSAGLELASLQQLAKQVVEKVSLISTLDIEQSSAEKNEEVQQVFEEVISDCRTGLPENTDFTLYSLVELDGYKLISITSPGFSTVLNNKPLSKNFALPVEFTPVTAAQDIVLQDTESGQVYATVRVPQKNAVDETVQTFHVLGIVEELTLLSGAVEKLSPESKLYIAPIIEKIISLANFKNQYVVDSKTNYEAIDNLQEALHTINLCLEKPNNASFENLKQCIHQLDKYERLRLFVGYFKQLLAQLKLAQIVAALPGNEVKVAAVKLLNNMAKICQDGYVPAMVNGKPKTLDIDAIRKAQLQVTQTVTNFAEITDEYLAYSFDRYYGPALTDLENNPITQHFAVIKEIISNAKELQAVKNKMSQTAAFSGLDKARQGYKHAAVSKALANFTTQINLLISIASEKEKQKLISIVKQTTTYLNAPTEKAYCDYKELANTVSGHSVLWQQLAGAMLILAGVVLAAACGAVLAASHGIALPVAVPAVSQATTWIAAGSSVLMTGLGIFACYSGRTKGLSKAMHDCALAVHDENKEKVTKSEDKQQLLLLT